MRPRFSATLLLLASVVAPAADVGWRDREGNAVPDTEDQRSVEGFGGWLVVTPDIDWEAKWNTPSDVVPHFTTASTVKVGQELTILIFFGNPRVDSNKHVRVECDLAVVRPDGTLSVDARSVICAEGPIAGDTMNLRLAAQFLKYVGESQDPKGFWKVEVTLYDRNRGVAVQLKTRFELVP